MSSTGKTFALLVGMATGAALTAFALSSRGKRTREEIAKKYNEISEGVKSTVKRKLSKAS